MQIDPLADAEIAAAIGYAEQELVIGHRVSARFSVGIGIIYRWMERPDLQFPRPALRIGQRNYWRLSDITAWQAAQAAKVREPVKPPHEKGWKPPTQQPGAPQP